MPEDMLDIIVDDIVDMAGMEVMLIEAMLIGLIMDIEPDIVTEAGMLAASVAEVVALFSKGEAETAAVRIEDWRTKDLMVVEKWWRRSMGCNSVG